MDMQLIAWIAATLVFASFFMKTIVPLRTVAIVSNLVFIAYALLGLHYGIFDKVLPIFVLHAALLPLNWLRLREVRNSIRSVRDMKAGGPPHAYLLPYMTPRPTQRGEALFQQGDLADTVYFIDSGTVLLPELGKQLGPGTLFGEVAVFSSSARRSTSAVCQESGQLFAIKGEKLMELFYQDQKFAFQIAKTLAGYASAAASPPLNQPDLGKVNAMRRT